MRYNAAEHRYEKLPSKTSPPLRILKQKNRCRYCSRESKSKSLPPSNKRKQVN